MRPWDRILAPCNWVALCQLGGAERVADKDLISVPGARTLYREALAVRVEKASAITPIGREVLAHYRPDPVSGRLG